MAELGFGGNVDTEPLISQDIITANNGFGFHPETPGIYTGII
jgi:hypothetical protein